MPTIKLTKTAVNRLSAPDPSGKQKLVWDADLKGFGVLISGKTATKTYVAQRALPDGRVRRVTIGATNEIELDKARELGADLLNSMRHGTDPKAERRSAAAIWTLRRTLDEYLKARKDLRPATIKDYRGAIERHLNAWLERPLASITADEIEERHRKIQTAVHHSHIARPQWGSTPGSHQANSTMRVLRILWNFLAERDAAMPANPVRRLRRQWYATPRRERLVKTEELPAFYNAVDALPNPIQRDYILLLLFTGLRRVEAAALKWDEVDFKEHVIRLPARRTKAARRLDLPMSSFVRDLLIARRAIGNDGGWVFPSDSRTGHIADPSHPLGLVAKTCGITVSPHDLRRTFVTVAEGTDISVMALKALVNHSLGNDVTSGYVGMVTERLREPAERVGQRLMALCGLAQNATENVHKLGAQ